MLCGAKPRICVYYRFAKSDKSVITVMPDPRQVAIQVSSSIMFVAPRYIAGVQLFSVAVRMAAVIGD